MIRDALRFFLYNLRHYSLALWGFRQQLEPDYPVVTRFFPALIRDSVYEWRTYGAMLLWSIAAVSLLPNWAVGILLVIWSCQSWKRARHFRTNYGFWKQAYRECPNKNRVRTEYEKWICLETARLMKAGHGGQSSEVRALDREARYIQDIICLGKDGKP